MKLSKALKHNLTELPVNLILVHNVFYLENACKMLSICAFCMNMFEKKLKAIINSSSIIHCLKNTERAKYLSSVAVSIQEKVQEGYHLITLVRKFQVSHA